MTEPEKVIPLHGPYRKLKSFQVKQLAISEARPFASLLPKLLSGELRVPATASLLEAKI
jgi:hypothetical protein